MVFNWFNHNDTQRTYRKITEQVIRYYGIPIRYMPKLISQNNNYGVSPYSESAFGQDVEIRSNVGLNQIFGEDTSIKYKHAIPMKSFLENYQEYQGTHNLFDKFGFSMSDEVILQVEIETWRNVMKKYGYDMDKPLEGDLICFDLYNARNGKPQIFEVKNCFDLQTYFMHGSLYVFKLTCQLWEYSHEKLETGDVIIDSLNNSREELQDIIGDNKIIEDKSKKITNWNPKDPFKDPFDEIV